MIEILILHSHILFALYLFTKRWQEKKLSDGMLSLAVIGLTFSIGWAIMGPLSRMILHQEYELSWFTSDTLSLVMLVIVEFFFFKFYFFGEEKNVNVESTNQQNTE
jgi:hypothetical protein